MSTATIQPLRPQSAQRVAWEELVKAKIAELGDMTEGDAQDLMDVQGTLLDSLSLLRTVPHMAAMKVLDACTGADTEVEPAAGNVATRIPSPLAAAVDSSGFGGHLSFAGLVPMVLTRGSLPADQFELFINRLAACFNACDGIETEALAQFGLSGAWRNEREGHAHTIETMLGERRRLAENTARVMLERNALHGALLAILPFARSWVERMHEEACNTAGQAGRELLTKWKAADDVVSGALRDAGIKAPAPAIKPAPPACKWRKTATLPDGGEVELIGYWSEFCGYYFHRATETVWAFHQTGRPSICGTEAKFRADFATKHRGVLL